MHTCLSFLLVVFASSAFATCSKLIDTAGVDTYHCPDTGNASTNGTDLQTFMSSQPYACGDTIILYAGVTYRSTEPNTDPMWYVKTQTGCAGKYTNITSSAASEIPFNQKQNLVNYRSKMPTLEVSAAAAFQINGSAELPTNNYKFTGLRIIASEAAFVNRWYIGNLFMAGSFDYTSDFLLRRYTPRNIEVDRCLFEQWAQATYGAPTSSNTNGNAYIANVGAVVGIPIRNFYWHDSYASIVGHFQDTSASGTAWTSYTTATATNPVVVQGTGLQAAFGISHNAACDAISPPCGAYLDGNDCSGSCARVVFRDATANWLPLNGKKYVRARADGNLDVINSDPNRGSYGTPTYLDGSAFGAFTGSSQQVARVGGSAQYVLGIGATATDVRVVDNFFEAWNIPLFFGGADGPKIDPATIQNGSTDTTLVLDHVRGLKVGMGVVFTVPVGSGKSDYCVSSSLGCWATDTKRVGRVTAINYSTNTVSLEAWGPDGLDGTAPESGDVWTAITTVTATNPAVIQGTSLHAALGIGYGASCAAVSPPCYGFMDGGTCAGSCARVTVRGATSGWTGLNGDKFVRARADGQVDVFNPDNALSWGTPTNFDASALGAFSGSSPEMAKRSFAWWNTHVIKNIEIRGNGIGRGHAQTSGSDAGKGVIEVKQCENCFFDGNVMGGYLDANNVPQANVGGTYFVTTRSQGGGSPNGITQNVRFSNNLGSGHLPDGTTASCLWQTEAYMADNEHSLLLSNNLHYEHNLHVGCVAPANSLNQVRVFGARNSSFRHNTYAIGMAQANNYRLALQDGCEPYMHPFLPEAYRSENVLVRDNIYGYGSGISIGAPSAAVCWPTYPGDIKNNVVVDTESVGTSAINTEIPNNFPVADYTGLFAGTCAYDRWTNCKMDTGYTHRGAASDGGDPGADIEQVQDRLERWSERAGLIESDPRATTMALRPGTWSIGSTKAAMRFQLFGSTPAACTVQIFTNRNRATAHADTSSPVACNRTGSVANGNVVNFVAGTASALTADTTYFYKITDGGRVMVGEFTTLPAGSGQSYRWSRAMECGTDGSTFGTAVPASTVYSLSSGDVRYCRESSPVGAIKVLVAP